jgi:hypothetical protein
VRRWLRMTFRSYRILSVDNMRDTMLIYKWNDVVATEVTTQYGGRYFFATDRVYIRVNG